MDEICGDARLSVYGRFAYLVGNMLRNIAESGPRPAVEPFFSGRLAATPGIASPGRALTEAFLERVLPQLLPIGRLRVLEIGCGSGSICRLLARLGYSGDYLGIDITDRFDRTSIEAFARQFVCADAREFDPGSERFDLIISVSALEHIPDEEVLISRLPGWLASGGVEIHFVPGGWGLAAYLWHGWRQYPLRSICRKFGTNAVASPLGGMVGTLLHLVTITLAEMLLRLPVRRRWPAAYGRLLDRSLKFDHLLPWCPTMHAVRRQRGYDQTP